jgi:UDP-N-acetylmuramoyl-tripeptide--D-alanyl-D-alanine ligase
VSASLASVGAGALLWAGFPMASTYFILALCYVAIAFRERRYRYKKPLVWTSRARRVFRLTAVLLLPPALLALIHPTLSVGVLQGAPLALILANIILRPFQERINRQFISEARSKLDRLNPIRIGITGSFGKTTVKYMLGEILEAAGPVYYSHGSINTVLGHTRHIRERLQWAHKYFVAEMGAYGIGSIKRLCDFIKPQYGIVTAVGAAHTERFGSLDAIAVAKSELVEEVCLGGGSAVINAEVLSYTPFKELQTRYKGQVISVGEADADADVTITAERTAAGTWLVNLRSKDSRIPPVTYDLPLIGRHNVLNSALAVTLALIIDNSILDHIPYFTKTIEQIPHRLQKLETPGTALVLDDAYNSNEQGFISAVSELRDLAKQRGGRSILVTPGIAELGLEHDRVHQRLGAFSAENCDLVFAINPARIRSFVEAFGDNRKKVIEVATLAAAREAVSRDLRESDVILYENDLPDLLEEKRVL